MTYEEFFCRAYDKAGDSDFEPYDYQRRLADELWPEVLDIPTGMGKTAAVTLAWLWKRGWREEKRGAEIVHETPRRLIWCLPMRVLVEQTEENIRGWLQNLGIFGEAGSGKVSVHVLMGGADDLKTWAEFPEQDMILIGTQDMLLSRALMRGYGMSRYQWPIHFALLHNDCLWAFDEVQLMGAGLATSTQLEAFRRSFPLARNSRSLWISATLNRDWLGSIDFSSHLDSLKTIGIGADDRQQAAGRLNAVKTVTKFPISLGKDAGTRAGLETYLQNLANAAIQAHDGNSQTLVVLNRVERAQKLFRLLQKVRPGKTDMLVHARFRASERAEQSRRLRNDSGVDRIIVATQAIEAGVDISSRVLLTELAPWASMVQRFGRCNRYGEHNKKGAQILWVDIEDDADALPYKAEVLATARWKLEDLTSASSEDLPPTDEARPLCAVLRRKDLLDLFNTDPDLSGFDVDVSDYIRDSGVPGLQVFWRDFGEDPNTPKPQGKPVRDELCPVSVGQAKELDKRKDVDLWRWDSLDNQWTQLDRDPRPGMTLLLRADIGGYDREIGFDAALKKPPVPVITLEPTSPEGTFGGDWRSLRQHRPVLLTDHLGHVADQAKRLCSSVGEIANGNSVIRAARWHDLGKAHKVFDATMHCCDQAPAGFLAKSPCYGRHQRRFFRHELASMLAWLAQHEGEPNADLIAYLIAAHHGKVRMSLRAMPTEGADTGVSRFARGVWDGDVLPALDFDGEESKETPLKLALMEIGIGEQGPSWTERTLKLLDQYGPFQLAWLETLVRLADWRASALEQQGSNHE